MKLLLENFKKSMKEQFRGPTEEPSFSDPGYGEPEGFDEMQDQATDMVQHAVSGKVLKLPNGDMVTYDDPNKGGGGQFILNQSEVFAQDEEEAAEKILEMLTQLTESIKSEIMENLGAGRTDMAQKRLKGVAGAAAKKLDNPAVNRAIGLATKRLKTGNPQQKVDFLLSMINKLGIEPDELQGLMSRLKGSTRNAVRDTEQVSEE